MSVPSANTASLGEGGGHLKGVIFALFFRRLVHFSHDLAAVHVTTTTAVKAKGTNLNVPSPN